MINLGLSRIKTLLARLGNPQSTWQAVHVAGTNGKGSVCSYISASLTSSGISNGRFTSPALITTRDSITMNDWTISSEFYRDIRDHVSRIDHRHVINATEFELLTATAFESFRQNKVRLAVIETGLGGRYDATNVLENVLCCAVTKIAMDHESFLGHTLTEVASHKSGIIKHEVPVVVDGSNNETVLDVVRSEATLKNAPVTISHPYSGVVAPLAGKFQENNLGVALDVLKVVQKQYPSVEVAPRAPKWPGRVQNLDYRRRDGEVSRVLLDGAHNPNAAYELGKYLRSQNFGKITLVMAMTDTKDVSGVLGPVLKALEGADVEVFVTEFEAVEDMPWVKSYPASKLESVVESMSVSTVKRVDLKNFDDLLKELEDRGRMVVVCGSLYLVGQVLKRHANNGGEDI